jgi:hypothetical protein
MGARLDKAQELFAAGDVKKALSELWYAEAEGRYSLDEQKAILELARAIRMKAEGRRRADAIALANTASANISRLTAPPVGPSTDAARAPKSRLSGRQANALAWICTVLLVAAGLTVFLPYFEVEPTDGTGPTYQFTGTELMSGSYKRTEVTGVYEESVDAAMRAEDAAANPFFVVGAAFLGLVTLGLRGYGAGTLALALGSIVVLIGGCASTFDLEILGPGPLQEHLGYGFTLGILFIVGAALIQAVLWRRGPRASLPD